MKPALPMHLVHGANAEVLAARYLEKHGLKLVMQNYRCRFGEIDLVMRDKNTLVFVEVRLRRNQQFGGAISSISEAKRAKITLTATHYLQNHGDCPCRFDVVLLQDTQGGTVEWLMDAF